MGATLWFAAGDNAAWFAMSGTHRVAKLGVIVGIGIAAYFGTLAALGLRLSQFKRKAAA
jgi:putative peptidoglycan lipid II flippase